MGKNNDIKLASHDTCTGCAACASSCPKRCINMSENYAGVLLPCIDSDICIGCKRCEKSCPIITPKDSHSEIDPSVYAAVIKDEKMLQHSSSGGMFYALARWTIEQGGVVFGAAFDGIHLCHQYTETIEGIEPFMGSKYLQSDTADSFSKAKCFLDEGRWVLYSGTPCQIAGLKNYLHKEYDRLVTVDLICHGVPSASIWERHITRLMNKISAKEIKNIRFRTKDWLVKEGGALNFYFFFFFLDENGEWKQYKKYWNEDPYFKFFMRHIFRPSCYQCVFRDIKASYADFTIGDCWNAGEDHPQMPIAKGISTIICHTVKAQVVFEGIKPILMVEKEPLSIMQNRYAEDKQATEYEAQKRMWKVSNIIAQYIPLEYMQWIYMHDRLDFVIRRKFQKIWKRNTK